MKKSLKMLILMLIFCVFMSGCHTKESGGEIAGTASGMSGTVESDAGKGTDETGTKSEEAETKSEDPPGSTSSSTSARNPDDNRLKEQSRLLKKLYSQDGENQGAYELPVSLGSDEMVICMECDKEKLLLLSADKDLKVLLFDLDTGKMIAEKAYEAEEYAFGDAGFLEDGRIWIYLPEQGKLQYLDGNLNVQKEVEVPESYEAGWSADQEQDILWSMDENELELFSYQIETGEETQYELKALIDELEESDSYWCCLNQTACGYAYVTVSRWGGSSQCYRISVLGGLAEQQMMLSSNFMNFRTEGGAYAFQKWFRLIDFSKDDELITLPRKHQEEIIDYQDQYLFCGRDNVVSVYDCEQKVFYDGYEIQGQSEDEVPLWYYVSCTAARPDSHQVIFVLYCPEETQVILYDLETVPSAEQFSVEKYTKNQIQEHIQENHQNIQTQYGLSVISVDEAERNKDASGYHLEKEFGILDELDANDAFWDFLDTLPDEMAAQMLEGKDCTVEICFGGPITGGEDSGNLSAAGAYVTSWFDEASSTLYSRMVIDSTGKEVLERNLAHEFFHLMEERFIQCETEIYAVREGTAKETRFLDERDSDSGFYSDRKLRESKILDWDTQWMALSPEDSYVYSYDESFYSYGESEEDYVYFYGKDPEQVYFLDGYCRTFPTEDRARIFEYLYMAGNGEELHECFESEHIREKAVYLCQLIRSCYPSVDTSSRNIWEKALSEEDWARVCTGK